MERTAAARAIPVGLRFRKSFGLGRVFRVNLTANGVTSVSIGGRGITTNLSSKGVRQTVSVRGTGVSFSTMTPFNDPRPAHMRGPPVRINEPSRP